MKTIFRIARLELSVLFYSPVAWLVLVIFTARSAYDFIDRITGIERMVRVGGKLEEATMRIYPVGGGFFGFGQDMLVLFMPLLTMGLMSRELQSGSIRLLMSSPVRSREIVLGKFLAIMLYGLLLVAILGIFSITGGFFIAHQDNGVVWSGLLSTYLLLTTYAAIGLFMSTLTSYQLVAAFSTMTIFAALKAVGGIWQDIDFLRDITYFLSISSRTKVMSYGLLVSKDVCYFLIITVLFLGLMYIHLENGRDTGHWSTRAGRYALYVVICLLAGYVSSRPSLILYKDVTATRSQTLTEASQLIVKKIRQPLKVHVLANLLDRDYYQGLPSAVNGNIRLFTNYRRFLPEVDIDYVRYWDTAQNAYLYRNNPGLSSRQLAMRMIDWDELDFPVLFPEQMRQKIDLSTEEYRLVRQLEIKGKNAVVRQFDDMISVPLEDEISAALQRLTDSVQTVVFVKGHGERNIQGADDESYKRMAKQVNFRYSLLNFGFDVRSVNLQNEDVPATTSVLVIADPKLPYAAPEISKVRQYIERGGNVLMLCEPDSRWITDDLTAFVGVRSVPGDLVQRDPESGPAFILGMPAPVTPARTDNYHKAVERQSRVEMPGAVALSYDGRNGFKADTLVSTDAHAAWLTPGHKNRIDTGELVFRPEQGDVRHAFPLVLALSRQLHGHEQRIVITGDADFLNNTALTKTHPLISLYRANYDIYREIFSWLSNGAFPVNTARPVPKDDHILMDESDIKRVQVALLWLLPATLATLAAVVLIRRKSK